MASCDLLVGLEPRNSAEARPAMMLIHAALLAGVTAQLHSSAPPKPNILHILLDE